MTRELMMRAILMTVPFALSTCVSACGAPADTPVATNTTATGDYVARVRALPDRQRDAVLFRAIRDAGHDCQQVTESAPAETIAGTPAWTATCDDGSRWVVGLSADGLATVGNAAAR